MKFIHLSDLHLGKKVNEYSMIEDQEYILNKIIDIVSDEKPNGVIIAGDVYDKSVPSIEAVELFNNFLTKLSKLNLKIFIISGNHDSAERIAFGSFLMLKSGVYLSPAYNGSIKPIVLTDEYGEVNIWMLPFVKPANVRKVFPDKKIDTYNDAVKVCIDNLDIDTSKRNIMITHQFVTGAKRSDSEEINVGGSDNIDVNIFNEFDYTALGHIHRPQSFFGNKVRYCGTPLKYSFSEANDKKSVTIVEIKEKGNLQLKTIDLKPFRDMVEIKGEYDEIMLKSFYENTTYQEDYVHITLTDEEDIPEAIGKLRSVYHNLMKLDYDNKRTQSGREISLIENIKVITPYELFNDFYKKQNNQDMNEDQERFIRKSIDEIWGNE